MSRLFLIMDVNSGRGQRIVAGNSLKQVQRRYPRCLVQPLPPAGGARPPAGIGPGPVLSTPDPGNNTPAGGGYGPGQAVESFWESDRKGAA